jgi:hypothetical protein
MAFHAYFKKIEKWTMLIKPTKVGTQLILRKKSKFVFLLYLNVCFVDVYSIFLILEHYHMYTDRVIDGYKRTLTLLYICNYIII